MDGDTQLDLPLITCPSHLMVVLEGVSHDVTIRLAADAPLAQAVAMFCAVKPTLRVTPSDLLVSDGNAYLDQQETTMRLLYKSAHASPLRLLLVFRRSEQTKEVLRDMYGAGLSSCILTLMLLRGRQEEDSCRHPLVHARPAAVLPGARAMHASSQPPEDAMRLAAILAAEWQDLGGGVAPSGSGTFATSWGIGPASMSVPFDTYNHACMRDDGARTLTYEAAIRARLDGHWGKLSVLDLGTGPFALLALFAARAGARVVYAVEADPASVQSAQEAVQAAGYAHIIEVVQGRSDEISLPEKVDVLISEIVGSMASEEGDFARTHAFTHPCTHAHSCTHAHTHEPYRASTHLMTSRMHARTHAQTNAHE